MIDVSGWSENQRQWLNTVIQAAAVMVTLWMFLHVSLYDTIQDLRIGQAQAQEQIKANKQNIIVLQGFHTK